MKILNFFLFLWLIFALLDLDPDPATQINADPDLQPCFNALILAYCLRCIDTWHRAEAILATGAAASVSVAGTVPSSVPLPLLITTPVCQPQVQGGVL
jgi:hypothetical protein